MNNFVKTGIIYGILGGLVTFIFGGWSVALIGVALGVSMGLSFGGKFERKDPMKIAVTVLPAAVVTAVILLAVSLIQNEYILDAIGKKPIAEAIVLKANLIGSLSLILFTCGVAAFSGLPQKTEQLAKTILLAVLILAFPYVDKATQLRWTPNIIFALIFVILGLGLNIVVGYAGLLDLGYAAFFAIGAYTTGILSSPVHNTEWNFWLVIWIAAAMAGLWGLLLGAPTLPLRGDYLAIVTLGFGEIVPVLFKNLIDVTIKEPFTCWILPSIFRIQTTCITFFEHADLTLGEKGISPIGRPWFPFYGDLPKDISSIHGQWQLGSKWVYIGEFQSSNPVTWYFLIIGIIVLSVFLINRLREGRLGRAWMAIREDELAATQMGIDPVKTKLAAFAMGATFSGFAGAFYAAYIRGIFPSVFDFSTSIIILCVVILGGIGNIRGVIVGGLVLMTADRLFLPALKDFLAGLLTHTILPALDNPVVKQAVKDNANPILYRSLLFGLTLVIMMAVRPEGLIPSEQHRQELHAEDK